MIRLLACALLLLAMAPTIAQQQQPQGQNPPSATPQEPGKQPQSQPPKAAPGEQDRAMANQDIESQLNSTFSNDPILSDADIEATVDDQNITLTGTVQSEGQRQRALALCQTYSRYRNIVDKMVTK